MAGGMVDILYLRVSGQPSGKEPAREIHLRKSNRCATISGEKALADHLAAQLALRVVHAASHREVPKLWGTVIGSASFQAKA